MRIKSIEIKNYKAFHGTYKINVVGKNLFIYGENGSGKSSLYYAVKDFFQSSMESIDLDAVENIFIKPVHRGQCSIEVKFIDPANRRRVKTFLFSGSQNDGKDGIDTSIKDTNKLKSFLTYKHLLEIHHIKEGEQIDLFNLLVKGVLNHFKYSLTHGRELGELWWEVESTITRETSHGYNITQKKREVNGALKNFKDAFGELFKQTSPEFVLKHAEPILEQFNHNISIVLKYGQAKPNKDYTKIENNHVRLALTYGGKEINKPHLFLNEARLSAIAISIYLGMIKRHPQGIPCKILFLDDIFIGLDIANRLPLLEILKTDFQDYQIFITTYDKPWYEYAKSYLEGADGWMTKEFYAQETKEGYEIPRIESNTDFLKKAKFHFNNADYKAAVVYTRSAFEQSIRTYCKRKRKKIVFKTKLKDYKSEDFWKEARKDVDSDTKTEVEKYRDLVLNPFSHYNTEKHEIRTELQGAIDTIRKLKNELAGVV